MTVNNSGLTYVWGPPGRSVSTLDVVTRFRASRRGGSLVYPRVLVRSLYPLPSLDGSTSIPRGWDPTSSLSQSSKGRLLTEEVRWGFSGA